MKGNVLFLSLELVSNIKIFAKQRNNWFYLYVLLIKKLTSLPTEKYFRSPHRKIKVGKVLKSRLF